MIGHGFKTDMVVPVLYHAACLRDQGKKVIKESSMVKLFCTEMACRAGTDQGLIFSTD